MIDFLEKDKKDYEDIITVIKHVIEFNSKESNNVTISGIIFNSRLEDIVKKCESELGLFKLFGIDNIIFEKFGDGVSIAKFVIRTGNFS